jgi:phage-related protein
LWSDIKNFVTTTNQAIGDFVTRKWQEITDFVMRVFGPIVQWFRDIWNNVSNSANDGVNSVMGFISGLPGRIWAAVSGAATWLYQTGRDVIMGFLNGVRDMVGRAVAEVKQMANDVIAGAKSILGIKSPSTVFKAFGQYTMEGYIVGIKGMTNPVLDLVSSVASNIAQSGVVPPITVNPVVSGIGASAVGGDGASAGHTVVLEGDLHLHVAGNLDPTKPVEWRETMKLIKKEITTLDREDS